MSDYDQLISREGGDSPDPLVPTPVSAQIIQEIPRSSAVMSLARKTPMSSKTTRQPALSVLPEAYFVNGDTGRKKTTLQQWENVTLVAEELAVIVPIPQAYLDDAQIPLWDEVRPRIAEAFGRKLDAAALFNTDKPATWSDALITSITAAGNTVTEGTGDDIAVDIANVGEIIAEDGFPLDAFASSPGLRWRLVQLRSEQGIPIYAPPAGAQPATLFGMTLGESLNGGWDTTQATLIGGAWSNAILGVRQDMTFRLFTEGVISDDEGAIVLNLMQQDSVALRCVMRLAWATANPVTAVNTDGDTRFPFGALVPSGS